MLEVDTRWLLKIDSQLPVHHDLASLPSNGDLDIGVLLNSREKIAQLRAHR